MRALVATVLLVLGLVSMAQAECAWVLWTSVISTNGSRQDPVDSYPTVAGCKTARRRVEGLAVKQPSFGMLQTFVCLPDTIDPREPKAKGQP